MDLYSILDHAAKYAAEQKPNTGYTSKVIAVIRSKCERGEYPDGTNIGVQIALQFDGKETPEDLTDIGVDEKRSPYGASFSMDGAMDCMDFYRNVVLLLYGFNCGDSTQLAFNKNKDKQVPWEERRELDLYLSKLSNKAGHPDATHAMTGIGKPRMLHTTSNSNPLRVENDDKYSASTRSGTGCFRILNDEQYNALIYNKAVHMKPTEPQKPTASSRPKLDRLLKFTYTTKGKVNVRASASLDSARLGATSGTVTVLGTDGEFIRIRFGSGFGYIHLSVVRRNDYMRGDDVKALQQLLGFTGKDVDGVFGQMTAEAVAAFQASHGLVVDGVVGPNTWTALGGQWTGK